MLYNKRYEVILEKMLFWLTIAFVCCVASGVKNVCPGGSFKCPDTSTCCQLLDKSYGCCPLEGAVCCDDHIHCCPKNTKCAVDMCISNDSRNSSMYNYLLKKNSAACPGEKFFCPDDTTCCKGKDPSSFGCCPMKDAVCCEDGYHCCPTNTVCDLASKKCIGKEFNYEMYDSQKQIMIKEHKYFLTILKADHALNVICPGSSFQCPNGYTCCKLPSGDWGCCPFQNAECCNDHLHCCPQSFKCDKMSQACMKEFNNITSALKIPAEKILGQEIICPDKTPCSNSTTCCKLGNTHYGCCPYEDATCCSDFVHCCPKNFDCDIQSQRCVPKSNFTVKLLR